MGVAYFENELLPGKPMFRCDRMSASLQVSACAEMWNGANAGTTGAPERLWRCVQCPIGAEHAGVANANMNSLRGSSICARCHRTDLRLIGGNLCVSCQNRQYEWLRGKNAKGRAPVKVTGLTRREVRYVTDGALKVLSRPHTGAMDELVVELLRDAPKTVVMGFGLGRTMLRQGALF